MAVYDLTANINYITNNTNYEKLTFIAHSQGTCQYFIKYTLDPEFIERHVERFVGIGPVVNVFNTTSFIVKFLRNTHIMKFMDYIHVKNMLVFPNALYQMISKFCSKVGFVCQNIISFFAEEYATNNIDFEYLFSQGLIYEPGGTSAKNVNHWVQFYETKEYAHFDYGKEENLKRYGEELPPKYDISKFKDYKIKSFVTSSNADPFSKEEDCHSVFSLIDKKYLKTKHLFNYNHLDYLWSRKATTDLYHEVLKFLDH